METIRTRASDEAYARYFAAMDGSMRQKVALAAAHFLPRPGSRLADIGTGSGAGAYALALLHPDCEVVGFDLDPVAVQTAAERWRLPNLSYAIGDAGGGLARGRRFAGILSVSTLHHVWFGSGHDPASIGRAYAAYLEDLEEDGTFVLRDTVAPPEPEATRLLDLSTAPRPGEGWAALSDAALLEDFARTARPLDRRLGPGFFLEPLLEQEGRRRYRLPWRWAGDFLQRIDYRQDWEAELLEQYCYMTLAEHVALATRLGGRVIHAAEQVNPWIVAHRWAGRCALRHEDLRPAPWPATHLLLAVRKVGRGRTVALAERRPASAGTGHAALSGWTHPGLPGTWDLVRRPGAGIDLLPWRLTERGRLVVAARHDYPRPVVRAEPRGTPVLDGATLSGFMVEPVSAVSATDGRPPDIAATLAAAGMVAAGAPTPLLRYHTSPGGIDELILSSAVSLARPVPPQPLPGGWAGLAEAGLIAETDAQAVLRGAAVGALPEARLEINVYALMADLGLPPDEWIGPELAFGTGTAEATPLDALLSRPATAPFAPAERPGGFMRLARSEFAALAMGDDRLPAIAVHTVRDFALPDATSSNSAVCLPALRDGRGRVLVGLELRELPAPQIHEGNAAIPCAPAWRLPRGIADLEAAAAFARARLGLPAGAAVTPLGAYLPSAGITPERVFVFIADAADGLDAGLSFVALESIIAARRRIRDGHLLVAAFRLAHATGWPA